jgi:hypothetical protein
VVVLGPSWTSAHDGNVRTSVLRPLWREVVARFFRDGPRTRHPRSHAPISPRYVGAHGRIPLVVGRSHRNIRFTVCWHAWLYLAHRGHAHTARLRTRRILTIFSGELRSQRHAAWPAIWCPGSALVSGPSVSALMVVSRPSEDAIQYFRVHHVWTRTVMRDPLRAGAAAGHRPTWADNLGEFSFTQFRECEV